MTITYKANGFNGLGQSGLAPVVDLLTPQPSSVELGVKRFASFEVDYTDIEAQDNKEFGPTFPTGTVVTRAFYLVNDTFTSGGADAATIGIGFTTDSATGIVTATAISAGGNIWDAGWHETTQDTGAVGDFIPAAGTTADRKILFTRAGGQDLTAGNLTLFVEYVVL